ncbi:MAG: hypothetical protein ACOH5I_23060 [Oligoflexus sp.]
MLFSRKTTIFIAILIAFSESGCYFFRKRSVQDEGNGAGVVGESLGARAGGVDALALAEVHSITTPHPPAGIRPDPDLFVRQLLLQYREEGSVVAREIGRVENYRILLGGANVDFTITAQESYDATSLLAKLKVASEVCEGLVAPDSDRHPGWNSILPGEPHDVETNLRFLIQRITGIPSQEIPVEMMESLNLILDTSLEDGQYVWASYIPVCATLVIDAGALML